MDTFAYGDASTEAQETISYGEPNVGAALSEEHLDARSKRADFAMADKSPGRQVLKDQFRSGGETQFRQAAAATADAEFRQDKLAAVSNLASKTKVTDTEVNGIMALGTTPEANPDTVIEDKFAKNMVNYGVAGDPGRNLVFQSAFDNHPEETQRQMAVGKGAISRKVQAQSVYEEAEAAYKAMPWFDTSGNSSFSNTTDKIGANLLGIVSAGFSTYINQRNLLNESASNSFLPGNNKLEQIQYLYLLPHADFKPALMAAAGPGSEFWKKDPIGALEFIKGAVSFSTSDAYVDNAFGIVNAASLLPVSSGLKAIGRLKGGENAGSAVQSMEKALAEVQAVLGSSPTPPVTPGQRAVASAADTATDVLKASPVPEKKFYMPEAAIKREWETTPRLGETRVENGTPRVFTDDGVEVGLRNYPEVGDLPVTVSESRVRNYTTKQGTVDFTPEGDGRTIYVSKADSQKLSQALDPDRNFTLLRDEKGVHVADMDNIRPGKMVPGSRVKTISETPAEGLYPVRLPEGSQYKMGLDDFGDQITKVNDGTVQNVKFGAKIVDESEIETRIAMADIVKAQAEVHPVDVLSKMGQHETAAVTKATTDLQNRFQQVVQGGDVEAIRRNVPSLYSPQTFFHNASSLTRERADRLAQEALQSVNDLSAAIADPTRVERLTGAAFDQAVTDAKTAVATKYNRASNSILDQVTHWDSASNTYAVETRFGKKDGSLFDSSAQATNYKNLQYRLGQSAEVKQEGNKFYLSHLQHLDETAPGVRNNLIVSENTTPQSWLNTAVNALSSKVLPGYGNGSTLRSSAFTTSDFQRNNRTVATHAPSIMRNALEDSAKTIGGLSKSERQDLQRILEHNRDYMHPDGERGTFYKSALEFETAYNGMFGKMPTEKQIAAYDQYTRLSDLDWTLRELDWHRDKARQGVRNYRLAYKTEENGVQTGAKTDWFNGKQVDNFDPVNTQNANIYIMPEGKFTTKFNLKSPTVEELQINAKIKSGEYQIIQVYNPGSKPLKGATQINDNIHFVVVDKFEDQAVKFGQNSVYRPGGHVIYQDQNFMKQPQIGTGTLGRETHFGDTTVKSFAAEKDGAAWVEKYNTARLLLRDGDEAGLKTFVEANLPETVQDFKKLFTDGGASLSVGQPFVLTKTGANTFESSAELSKAYPGLKDTFSSYDLTQTQDSKFLASRDKQLSTIANKGTEENPIYVNVDSRLYDPYTSLQKGVAQIVRERWMGDYKKQAAESWVQEFGMLFDQSKLPLEKLRQNPVYWVYHAEGNLQTQMARTQPELYSAAMVSRRNIMNFIGAQDEVGLMMSGLEKKVIAGIESIGGKNLALKAEETYLPAIKDAPAYARAGAFHSIIGLFNPAQLFQQAQGLTHVLALSPLNGLNGTTASALARVYRYTENPAILEDMANKASRMGWNKEHFKEAWDAWKASGTHNVGGETAMLDQVGDPKLFKGAGTAFLDKGQIFFKAGESIVRDTGFFTAYLDWRKANPAAVLDNRAMGDITRRFDTLTMNMTRASNAAYNEGLLSPVTQFWTWNARFSEQMLGKQLTMGEKARAFTAYSAMYGVPSTLGGVTFGMIPYANYQDIREWAIKNQIDLSNKFYQAFSEGLPAMLTNAITGHDTDFQRFAPNATQLSDIVAGKKSVMDVLGGASGTWVRNVYASTQPFRAYVWSGLDENLGLKMNDFIGLAENLSGFTNLEKAYIGLTTGKYMSKNEMYQGDVDNFDSFMLALGLGPKEVSDAYSKIDIAKQQKAVWDKTEKLMMENYRLGFAAAQRGEYQVMSDYMLRNNALSAAADFTMQKKMDVFKRATGGQNDNLVDSVNQSFLKNQNSLQNIPAMKRYYELQEKRKQP